MILMLVPFLFTLTISCGKTDAEKKADADKQSDLLYLLVTASRNATSGCSYYGKTQGCSYETPYSCAKSSQCSSSSTCSNLLCNVSTEINASTKLTGEACDSSKFNCSLKTKSL